MVSYLVYGWVTIGSPGRTFGDYCREIFLHAGAFPATQPAVLKLSCILNAKILAAHCLMYRVILVVTAM